jgi:IS5 family transposase
MPLWFAWIIGIKKCKEIQGSTRISVHLGRGKIYRNKLKQPEFEDFYLPFGGRIRSDNRWVILSKLIPWGDIEKRYAKNFSAEGIGAPAKPVRLALGSLIIKERQGLTDEETVMYIQENPYAQFFLGFESYYDEEPFDPSLMVYFRKRLGEKTIAEMNELVVKNWVKRKSPQRRRKKSSDDDEDAPKQGKLILDTSCAPADIRYPTDLSLLNEGREKLEGIIDVLHEPLRSEEKKPRTYRRNARKDYLNVAKKKKATRNEIRKAVGKQLRYVKRDLGHIERLKEKTSLSVLKRKSYRDLLVIHELYRQQKQMWERKEHKIPGRIVSISQPHVRPIVRGKAKADVEFGAKIAVSLINGYSFLDRISWDPYHESQDLIGQVEKYKQRFGCYPVSIHADKIYRTRENLAYCRDRGIRLSGPPLGRPKIMTAEEAAREKRRRRRDERYRIPIEGKFGQGKRRFSLDRIMTKLAVTSGSAISVIFLVMNLEKLLRDFLLFLSSLPIVKGLRKWLRRARVFYRKPGQPWITDFSLAQS